MTRRELAKKLTNASDKVSIDSIDSLICSCDSPMIMRFFYPNARGLRGHTESRRLKTQSTAGDIRWRRFRTTEKDWIIDEAEGLKKLMTRPVRKRLSDEAEIDSIDSLICSWGSPMLMWLFYVNARWLLGELQTTIWRRWRRLRGGRRRQNEARIGEQAKNRTSRSRSRRNSWYFTHRDQRLDPRVADASPGPGCDVLVLVISSS
jgi:hypothetical protein